MKRQVWQQRKSTAHPTPPYRGLAAGIAGLCALGALTGAVSGLTARAWANPDAKAARPATTAAAAKTESGAEIQVTLFGQPCLLTGPVSESMLRAIHSISPEQTPPTQTAEQARKTLEKIKQVPNLPAALDRYREKLTKHLESQLAFLDGMAAAKKSGKAETLLAATRDRTLSGKRAQEYEAMVKKFEAKEGPAAWNSAIVDQLSGAYNDATEPNPEEEFHRTIQRMSVKYVCSFEENEGGE